MTPLGLAKARGCGLPRVPLIYQGRLKMVFEKDSESKVEEVQNKTANFMASKISKVNKGYIGGTGGENSSLNEQRKMSYGEDPYDDANFNTLILTHVVIVRLQQEVLPLPRRL
ncbi:hypothetical protein Tco_0586266 [Tanacetum coccineum]